MVAGPNTPSEVSVARHTRKARTTSSVRRMQSNPIIDHLRTVMDGNVMSTAPKCNA